MMINNSSYYLCEEFDEDCFADDLFPPHSININYNIYMDIIGKNDFDKKIEGICIFFSLTSFPVNISLDFSFRQKILTVQRADSANCFTEADYIIVV